MGNAIDRRDWLKKSSLVLAGLGLSTEFFGAPPRNFFIPGNPILLNSNENAYGPSPMARKAILENYLQSNRYPDDVLPLLKKKIASHWNVHPENILLGAGSSDIIGLACQLAGKNNGNIVTAEPSYKVWNGQAATFGYSFKRSALNAAKCLDLDAMVGSIDGETKMIYFCNPNNPTGTFRKTDELSKAATEAASKTLVFVDEAYTEFAGLDSLASQAVQNPKIIVAKTFSKVYGLAGARVGYAIAHQDTIRSLSAFQYWPDAAVSMVSSVAALASLDDQAFVKECVSKVNASKEMCYATFKELSLEYIPSATNFVLFNIDRFKGDFTRDMESKGIYVQFRDHFGGKWCRVSIGTTEEMNAFCKALKELDK